MKRGRPPKLKEEKLAIVLHTRLTREEYRKLCASAKRAGLTVSKFIRAKLVGGKA